MICIQNIVLGKLLYTRDKFVLQCVAPTCKIRRSAGYINIHEHELCANCSLSYAELPLFLKVILLKSK